VEAKNKWSIKMGKASEGPSLFFILGRGRSGTTLITRILSEHPQINVAPEGFFILSLWPTYRSKIWTNRTIENFCKDLFKENRIKTWQLNYQTLKDELYNAAQNENLSFPRVCQLVYKVYALENGGPVAWVGDKNPHYALFVKEILKIFPDAPVIFLTRDYRTNIQSYQHVPFDLQDTAALAYRWKIYNEAILNVSQNNTTNFYYLPFESLLKNPEAELKEVCHFLNVSFQKQMMNFYNNEPNNFYGQGSPWFDKINQPLNPDEANKEVQLSESALRLAHDICQPTGQKLGYETDNYNSSLTLSHQLGKLVGFLKASTMVLLENILFLLPSFFLKDINHQQIPAKYR